MPPAPGMMARRDSGRATVAFEERTRKWVERASSRPPPRAREEIAEIVGTGRWAREVNVARRLERNSAVLGVQQLGRAACREGSDSLELGEGTTLLEIGAGAEATIDGTGQHKGPRGAQLGGDGGRQLVAAAAVLGVDAVELGAEVGQQGP